MKDGRKRGADDYESLRREIKKIRTEEPTGHGRSVFEPKKAPYAVSYNNATNGVRVLIKCFKEQTPD